MLRFWTCEGEREEVAKWIDGDHVYHLVKYPIHDAHESEDSQESEDETHGKPPEKSCERSPGVSNGDQRTKRQADKGSDQKRRKKST